GRELLVRVIPMRSAVMETLLPRLRAKMRREADRCQGNINQQHGRRILRLLKREHTRLVCDGMSDYQASLHLRAAVIILSRGTLREGAAASTTTFEYYEHQTVLEAAREIAGCYSANEWQVAEPMADLVARYGE